MTTAYIAPSFGAGWQALDNLGNPLSGGFLYTYSAGTTTPYSTWTDSTLSVPNANPIILNSAGRPPNEIWFDSTSYKFVLTDSLSNVLGTWDNIQGVAGPAGSTPVISGTSLTSQTIGTGSFTFVTQANIALVVGQWVTVSYSTTPSNYFYGQITAYSGTSLTVNVTVISGSGTYASWVISISGVRGPTGSPGAGSGTVTSVAVATANGFAGSVATSTTTPNITLSCNTIGILQGNGTAISAITVGSGLSFSGGTLAASSSAGGTVTSVSGTGGGTGLTLTGGPITTSGTLSLGGILGITNGGTGQSSANAALNALLPSQATYSGRSLVTNGTNTSWTQVGTVYSVGMTVPAFLSITGSPVTGTGTLAIGLSGTPLPIANGGTGQTTFTAGQVLYGNGTSGLSTSANMTFSGTALTLANDASISGLNVGKGAGAVATNTAVGYQALFANTTGIQNTASGASALQNNTTGNYNTASGLSALQNNTTGIYNTANGVYALFSNTTGNYNTASGASALQNNTTGIQNTASGASALQNNTTGNYNTASGLSALQANTTASQNTAVGYQAGYSNTTGTTLDAFGYQVLYANTTGTYNAAFGALSLTANTTGNLNSAYGPASLATNTTGSNNAAFGSSALRLNTTASNNTAVGYQAGYSNTTGAGNTFVGYTAGTAVTSGSNLTVIGNTAAASSATATNEVTIGNSSVIVTRLGGTTVVESLPSAATVGAGARAFVTNALAPAFGATVAGGGAVPVPVYSDGTNWKVG